MNRFFDGFEKKAQRDLVEEFRAIRFEVDMKEKVANLLTSLGGTVMKSLKPKLAPASNLRIKQPTIPKPSMAIRGNTSMKI